MKQGVRQALYSAAMMLCATLPAAPLSTVQNSTLSVPAANIAAPGVPGATNLLGSNFLMSALSPSTSHGGRAWPVNSQRWVQRYPVGSQSQQSSASAMVLRRDGSIVATGYSYRPVSGYDFLTICFSPDGKPLWTNLYDGPVHGDDNAAFVACGSAGDIWVTGPSMRVATNYESMEVVLLKYASSGIPLWTNRYTSAQTNADYPGPLAVDSAGNAYLVVSSVYWPPDQNGGNTVGYSLIKYAPSGATLWTNFYPAFNGAQVVEGLNDIEAMTVDSVGNVFVAGQAFSDEFGGGAALVKLAPDGTAVWTNFQSFVDMGVVRSVLLDAHGDIVLTGEGSGSPHVEYVAMKISATGASIWTNNMAGPTYDGGSVPQTLLDPLGNVLLVGGSSGAASPGSYQIRKLNTNGIPLWTNLNATLQTNDSILDTAALDNAGNLYLAGYSPRSAFSKADFVTVKYSSEGVALWTNRFDGGAGLADAPVASVVDDAGNLYVAGESRDLAGSELTVVKYADLMFYSPPKDFIGSDAISYSVTDKFGNQATGSISVAVVAGAFRLTVSSPTNLTPAGFRLRVDGAPGTNGVVIEASTNLTAWRPIITNSPVNGSFEALDSSAVNLPRRYYRAIQQQ